MRPRPLLAERDLPLWPTLIASGVVGLLGLAFMLLGSEAIEGETRGLDMTLLLWAQSLRGVHPGFAQAMRDVSSLGSTTVLTLVTLSAVAGLLVLRARLAAQLLAASVVSGTLAMSAFKTLFGRARPDPALADAVVAGLSYPSGHASLSAIVFLSVGALVATRRPPGVERWLVMALAFLLALLIGVSRVVLGAHWATDVLGGWAFGAGWALAWLLVDRRLTERAGSRAVSE